MKSFINDSNGLSLQDFEKIVFGLSFIALIVTAIVCIFKFKTIDTNLVYLTSTVGGLFVLRKGLKYNADTKLQQTMIESGAAAANPMDLPKIGG
jgi:hypothetical protein